MKNPGKAFSQLEKSVEHMGMVLDFFCISVDHLLLCPALHLQTNHKILRYLSWWLFWYANASQFTCEIPTMHSQAAWKSKWTLICIFNVINQGCHKSNTVNVRESGRERFSLVCMRCQMGQIVRMLFMSILTIKSNFSQVHWSYLINDIVVCCIYKQCHIGLKNKYPNGQQSLTWESA